MIYRIFFSLILLLHGLIHFIGFAKAYRLAGLDLITKEISKSSGPLWLLAALFFITSFILFLLKKQSWWMIAIPALILSQVLIIMNWQAAKFATIPNVFILCVAVVYYADCRFEKKYSDEMKS